MSAFSFPLQEAIYERLIAAPPIGADVFDHDPGEAPYPHIVIGESQVIPDDVSKSDHAGDDGVSEFLDLHVYDRPEKSGGHRGAKRAKAIAGLIKLRLHSASLAVPGRASVLSWVRTIRTFTQPDGVTAHSVVTVEVIHRS